jgi:DNA-binding response OmpR family regulator
LSNKTILFADDSATMRAIVEKTFMAEPFDVVSVPSGEAAITRAKEIRPDVIIVDVGLAGVTGYDVCEAARKDSSLSDTPFVMISGVSHIYDAKRGKAVGVDEHMKKPFDTGQIIEKVTELANRSRRAKPLDLIETKEKPVAVIEPEPEGEDEAEVEAIPLAEDEEVYTPDAMTSLDSPLDLDKPSSDTKDYARPIALQKPKTDIGRPKPSMQKPASPMEMAIDDEETLLGNDEPEEVLPEVEPIEIKPQEPVSQSFQVGTLAELAQMDNKGTPLKVETDERAIELKQKKEPKAAAPTPLVRPLSKDRIQDAAKEVARSIPGVTGEQIAAVQALTADIIERVVWEVVPDLAETIIKEELAKLFKE